MSWPNSHLKVTEKPELRQKKAEWRISLRKTIGAWCVPMISPLQGRKGGQAQWTSPRWDHSDDLTVSPGVCGAKTWGSVPTWKSPKVRWQCLSEDGEEDLSWEDTGHPVWCWVLHEAQVWATRGEEWLGTEGLSRPWGGATDGKGTSGDGERAQGAGKMSEESMRMPHKGISTECPAHSRESMPHLSPVLPSHSGACLWAGRKGRSRPCLHPHCRLFGQKQAKQEGGHCSLK